MEADQIETLKNKIKVQANQLADYEKESRQSHSTITQLNEEINILKSENNLFKQNVDDNNNAIKTLKSAIIDLET